MKLQNLIFPFDKRYIRRDNATGWYRKTINYPFITEIQILLFELRSQNFIESHIRSLQSQYFLHLQRCPNARKNIQRFQSKQDNFKMPNRLPNENLQRPSSKEELTSLFLQEGFKYFFT